MSKIKVVSKHNMSREEGVIMPLLAIVMGTLIVAIFVMGLDGMLVKHASTKLKRTLDDHCKAVAFGSLIQRKVSSDFGALFTALKADSGMNGLRIIEARVIAPTMPAIPGDDSHAPTSVPGGACAIAAGTGKIPDACTHNYQVEKSTDPFDNTKGFPNRFWRVVNQAWNNVLPSSQFSSSGVVVACEVKAELDTFASGVRVLSARTAYWRQVRGLWNYLGPGVPPSPDWYSPGLTIAIAPHMNTNSAALKFQFDPSYTELANYDPLKVSGGVFEYTGFSGHLAPKPLPIPYSAIVLGHPRLDKREQRDAFGNPVLDAGGNPVEATIGFDRAMRVASMNPAIMVRNVLASTFVELASRHGHLRTNTEILVTGTQVGDSSQWSHPTQITQLGDDLVVPPNSAASGLGYQIPYLFYKHGTTWVNPFDKNFGVTRALNDPQGMVHSLIASQLRVATQLYYTTNGLKRWTPHANAGVNNDGYEPSVYVPRAQLRANGYTSGNSWDSLCPWYGTSNWPNVPTCIPTYDRDNTATEVVSTLGSISSCPIGPLSALTDASAAINQTGYGLPIDTVWRTECAQELNPDISGLLGYLNGSSGGVVPVGNRIGYRSPGIIPFGASIASDLEPFGAGHGGLNPATHSIYTFASNIRTPIVLFLHKPISQSEANIIRTIVDGTGLTNTNGTSYGNSYFVNAYFDESKLRNITVFYIPTTVADAVDGQVEGGNVAGTPVDRIRWAFNAPMTATGDPFKNRVYVLSPESTRVNTSALGGTDCVASFAYSGDPETAFREYWHDLLGRGPHYNAAGEKTNDCAVDTAESIARRIFLNRMLTLELKL